MSDHLYMFTTGMFAMVKLKIPHDVTSTGQSGFSLPGLWSHPNIPGTPPKNPTKKRLVEAKEYLKHGVLFQQPFKEIPSGTLLTVAWRRTSGVFHEGAARFLWLHRFLWQESGAEKFAFIGHYIKDIKASHPKQSHQQPQVRPNSASTVYVITERRSGSHDAQRSWAVSWCELSMQPSM